MFVIYNKKQKIFDNCFLESTVTGHKQNRKIFQGVFGLLLLFCASSVLSAENVTPIYVANQNPFTQIFGLPKAEPGTITALHKFETGYSYYVSNNAIQDELDNGESIIWDGETARIEIKLRYGLLENLELGLDIPFVQHSGGFLDSIIRKTHKILGFPNDRQNQFEIDQIHYEINKNDKRLYESQERSKGLGDIRFSIATPIFSQSLHKNRHLALRASIKLPTGDYEYLLGSGGTDFTMGVAFSDYQSLRSINTVLTTSMGIIFMGDTKVLAELQSSNSFYSSIALNWSTSEKYALKLQLDFHSAFYSTELAQLGTSLQLLMGASFFASQQLIFDVGMTQNTQTDATTDVGFYFQARQLY
ncbi:MAG: DUF3187 family protein [Thiohalomonadales bacterium]